MAGQALRVSVEDLHVRAARLEAAGGTVRTAHGAAHATVAAVVPHFGTSASGTAIGELLGSWEEETQAHHTDMTAMAAHHRCAATKYTASDDDGRQRIVSAGPSV
jgi:hypothetical protein